jgi:hypothetical protein
MNCVSLRYSSNKFVIILQVGSLSKKTRRHLYLPGCVATRPDKSWLSSQQASKKGNNEFTTIHRINEFD